MPVREEAWPEGTPSWVDVVVDDPVKGSEFYAQLFGWDVQVGSSETGGYRTALKNGQPAAGLMGKPEGMSMSSVWTTYFETTDADATQQKITAAGGLVTVPATDVSDIGRFLVAEDTAGAVFGVWESRGHTGANIYNETGSYVWNDLHTKEYDAVKEFYSAVFGWRFAEIGDDSTTYSVFTPAGGDDSVGGLHLDAQAPDGAPAYWLTWFQTDDVDDTIATVVELGGSVLMPGAASPFGYMSIVTGSQGEAFGLIDVSRRTEN